MILDGSYLFWLTVPNYAWLATNWSRLFLSVYSKDRRAPVIDIFAIIYPPGGYGGGGVGLGGVRMSCGSGGWWWRGGEEGKGGGGGTDEL